MLNNMLLLHVLVKPAVTKSYVYLEGGDLPLLLEGKQISYGSPSPVDSGREHYVWHNIKCMYILLK